jgi:protein SCO1/2
MMRFILAGILVLMAAVIGWMTFDWYRQPFSGEAFGAPFTLVDDKGKPITERRFAASPALCSSASPIARKSARRRWSKWTAG